MVWGEVALQKCNLDKTFQFLMKNSRFILKIYIFLLFFLLSIFMHCTFVTFWCLLASLFTNGSNLRVKGGELANQCTALVQLNLGKLEETDYYSINSAYLCFFGRIFSEFQRFWGLITAYFLQIMHIRIC